MDIVEKLSEDALPGERQIEREARITLARVLREARYEITRMRAAYRTLTEQRDALKVALHRISLGSQNPGTTKENLGREARAALTASGVEEGRS